ncbi:MAG: YhfC family glutamic-type intramembrane protease, partial [Oscillospiraceae bacterium]
MATAGYFFTIFVALVLPLAAAVVLATRKKGYIKPFIFGVLTFVVFQVLTRIPILQMVLPKIFWYNVLTVSHPVLNGLFLAVTAAIFEEFGRYIVMKLFLKKRRRFYDAVSFGFGHGGIEAILFVGINTLATFLMYGTLMASAENVFLSGVERLGTMVFHIFMSVLVMYSVSAKKPIYLVFALLAHTAVDFFLPQMMRAGVNIWLIE